MNRRKGMALEAGANWRDQHKWQQAVNLQKFFTKQATDRSRAMKPEQVWSLVGKDVSPATARNIFRKKLRPSGSFWKSNKKTILRSGED